MNARHLFLSTLSIGTLAIATSFTATTLTAAPSQANPSFSSPQPISLHTANYNHSSPATIAFHNNSNCDIQVLLTNTREVRYLAPGQTAHFLEATVGSNPNFRVYNTANGSSLRTISLHSISSFTNIPFNL